ncbi:centrosomal protein of 72 kDa isoform X2 [Syngnathoides biaculeatus]|uniref:centrosomal protein of 72 kDa isoform X2 n=1 Tax=Syngnathoides biaculeatus TaxID=300417 RepID=UPI002ADE0298|nr:centrosomal protein of 72 kDa isoform X2 [Syngnathoides biaculeatus]
MRIFDAFNGDVRSLSLPGTYKQKIGYLGNGLANFERLKSLNLSHNSLVSLEGLQHLKHLQILNLYYNCIPSLEEVKVLFELSFLRELDLRLNPLGKIYPHYRPFVVLAMASLRKLDGCPVKDAERKAAKKRCSRLRSRDDRQALVERLSMKLSLLSDEDDVGSNPVDIRRSHSYSNEELQSAPDHQCPSPSHSGSSPFFNRSWLTKPGLQAENKQQDSYRKPLEELLDVMDKHWVGKRTLQLNTNFLTQIVQILSMMENHISSKDAEVKTLKEEVGALCFFAAAQEREHKADVTEFTARLVMTRIELQNSQENSSWERKLLWRTLTGQRQKSLQYNVECLGRAQHAAEGCLGEERRPPEGADHVRTSVPPVYGGPPARFTGYRGSEEGGGAEEGGGGAEKESQGGSRASRTNLSSDWKCAGV